MLDQMDDVLDQALDAEEAYEQEEEGLDETRDGEGTEADEEDHGRAGDFPDPEAIETPPSDSAAPSATATSEAAADTRSSGSIVTIRDILGVPLWYERLASPGPRGFPVAAGFVPLLERTVRAIRNRAPEQFGELERISSAGLYVSKGGAHGQGRACDWDRLVFEHVEIAPIEQDHLSGSRAKRQRYWGFAAICRSVASPTLHGEYDRGPHDDHVHLADNMPFRFEAGSHSAVTLLQAVLNEIFGQSPKLAVDGAFGPKSRSALAAALERVRLDDSVEEPLVWQRFLRRSARLGFALSAGQ